MWNLGCPFFTTMDFDSERVRAESKKLNKPRSDRLLAAHKKSLINQVSSSTYKE
jgi:hypothetical protein